MPQLFQVVRCYACQVFQVQQVKKIPKWVCKMCGEKQSLKKEYSRGSGSDCRRHVQKLNMTTAGEFRNADRDETLDSRQEIGGHNFTTRRPNVRLEDEYSTVAEARQPNSFFANPEAESSASRWQAFVADGDEMPAQDDDDDSLPQLGNVEVTLSRPVYQGRGGRKFGGLKSGRKRKRGDQDIDVDPVTETCENRNFPRSASQQNRPALSGCLKMSSFQDPGNIFPNLTPSVLRPQEPARQLSNVGNTDRARIQTWKTQVENSSHGQNWDRNDSTDGADAGEVAKKRQPAATRGPAESGWTAGGSKWGQFLHESEDTNDENEDEVDNRGHVAKPFSEFGDARTSWALVHPQSTVDQICRTEDVIDNRGHASKNFTVSSTLASNRQHTGRQSTYDPNQPVTSAQGRKFDRTQTSKNRSGFQTKIKDLFSLEDEGLVLVEALQENW